MKTIIAMLILGLCLSASMPMVASAQGSFPGTAILDDFNRADEGPPPSANWISDILNEGDDGLVVSGNQCVVGEEHGAAPNAYWSAETFGPDCEVFVESFSDDATSNGLWLRIANPQTDDESGYQIVFDHPNILVLRWVLGEDTEIYSIESPLAPGDGLGVSASGSVITLYSHVDGAWEQFAQYDDGESAIIQTGYIGVSLSHGYTADNFGGGSSEVAPAAPFRLFLPILYRLGIIWPSTVVSPPDKRR